TEINHYDAENDEINVQDVYQWQAETDEFLKMGESSTLEQIKFDRGWTQDRLDEELFKRRAVLAYLIDNGLNTYTQVAATFQAFINDPDTILALMANDGLQRSLEDLRGMESVLIDIDPEREAMVPRPTPDEPERELAREILDRAEEELFPEYRGEELGSVASALVEMESAGDVTPESATDGDADADPSADDGADAGEGPSTDEGDADDGADAGEGPSTDEGDADDGADAREGLDGWGFGDVDDGSE
ncbi:MAG: secretion system protein E, partial [Haloferacaceae archaeon]